MNKNEIINQIKKCAYDTTMAKAFRDAAGVPMPERKSERKRKPIKKQEMRDFDAERNERYWRKMMHQKTGVCG